MTTPFRVPALSRRSVLAATALTPAASLCAAVDAGGVLPSGLFRGDDRIRVGIIGCGGRGTGAAIQAACADRGVRVVALADLFADQIASSSGVLEGAIGQQFECPNERRFVGAAAHRDLLACDVDVVILAAPPATRPAHLAAAVNRGVHMWCETPAAIDDAGLEVATAALAEARQRSLIVASALCSRWDAPTMETIRRIHDGAIGRVLSVAVHHDGGLPWWKPAAPGTPAGEIRQRNWIGCAALSGGHFVEHHIHALDRALWVLGDDKPVSAAKDRAGFLPVGGDFVRFAFDSGRTLEASCRRSESPGRGTAEVVVGTHGSADLLAGVLDGPRASKAPKRQPGQGGEMYQLAMAALLRDVRLGGNRLAGEGFPGGLSGDSGQALLRASALGVMGRMALEGRPQSEPGRGRQTPRPA